MYFWLPFELIGQPTLQNSFIHWGIVCLRKALSYYYNNNINYFDCIYSTSVIMFMFPLFCSWVSTQVGCVWWNFRMVFWFSGIQIFCMQNFCTKWIPHTDIQNLHTYYVCAFVEEPDSNFNRQTNGAEIISTVYYYIHSIYMKLNLSNTDALATIVYTWTFLCSFLFLY